MTTLGLDLEGIRRGIADFLAGRLGSAASCYPYQLKAKTFPSITVIPSPTTYADYYQSFDGTGHGATARISLVLEIQTASADVESEQIAMDRFLSAGTPATLSIIALFQDDATCGGVLGNCTVSDVGAPFEDSDGHLTAHMNLLVLTSKNPV